MAKADGPEVSRAGLRFAPPPVELSADLRWLLARAFGPPAEPVQPPTEPLAALAAARRLSLAARIGARLDAAALEDEAGEEVAAGIHRERVAAAFAELTVLALAREVAEVAAGLGLPIVLLKFAALRLTGAVASGSRAVGDLDVLAAAERAPDLSDALAARGFAIPWARSSPHQLPALVHPDRGTVEITLHLAAVTPPGAERFAGYEELAAAGALRRLAELPGEVFVPAPELLAAHALAHGIDHHGFKPRSYPLMRMLADLVDLGLAGPGGEELLDRARRWIDRSVSAEEARATLDLCRRLAAAVLDSLNAGADGPGTLLRHIVAGTFDDDYARSLKLEAARRAPSDRPPLATWTRRLHRALILDRGQVEAIYGRPKSPLGYAARRLLRPFDLLLRLARSLISRRRLRRRTRRADGR